MGADERFLGVLGYHPQHVETIAELGGHRARLDALVGSTFRGSLACWDTTDDEWFTDAPLILEFDHARLELAAFKLHLCVSWNEIDVGRRIEWADFRLAWKANALPPLDPLRGQVIDELNVIEYRGDFNGLGLRAGDASVEVYNAFDELGLRSN